MLSGVLPLSDDEAAQLEQHLRECGRCESLADVFPDNDTLIEALRTQADASEVQHPLIQQLVARLSRLQAPGSEVTIGLSQSQDAALAPPLSPDEIGRLGGYRVLKVLGAGGMGMVYQAEDVQLQRAIALKVMKAEVSNNPGNRERFLREARAAAKLKSDHVVNIYQVGEERQVVFLAMEFLEGMALDDWLKKGRTPTWAQAARIGRQIALGLADAHACGLIHRDIKPGNIWLDSRHQGRVKLLDFGLARGDSEEVHLTQSGAIVGTPSYMAPEQARGEKVDFRADLFSLGVVLYRMTTGQLPFRGDNTMSILTALALDAPKPPREISAEMPPRLAALIERLLAKDRAQRPATAKAVADELAIVEREATQPAADERTVQVRAASVSAPVGPTARSRSRLRWLAAASLLLLLGGIAAAVVVIIRDKQGHKVAEINLPEGHSVEVKADDKDKGKPPEKDKKPAAAIPADPLAKIEPGTPLGPMALVTNPAPLPGVRSWTIETRMPRGGINAVAYRPDGRLLATAGEDSVIRLLDPKSGQVIRALVGHMAQVTLLAWSPDGRTLASGSWDGTVRLWDADSGRSLRTLTGLAQPHALAWSTDGRSVLGCCNPDILTWDAVTGKTLHKVSLGKVVMQPAFSPDGKLLAGESDGHTVRIWEARTGREVRTLKGHTAALHKVAWSPDGKRLASAASLDAVRVWDAETGKELRMVKPQSGNSYNPLAWSPDGRTLVLDTADRHSSVLDLMAVDNPGALRTVPACADAISVSWSPDGKTVASGGIFGDVAVTDVETGARTELHPGPAMSHLTGLAWSPDSKQLAAATYGAVTRVVNPTTGEATATLTDAGQVSAWSPSKWLAAAGPGPDYQLLLWQPGGGRRVLPAHKSGGVRSLAWSPDGKTLADAGTEQDLRLWDGAMRQAKATWNVGPVVPGTPPAWSPDGKLLAICIQDGAVGKVKVLRTDSGEEQRAIPNFNSAAWSPVGETLAVFNGYYPNVQLVNAKTGEAGVRLTTGGQDGWSPGGVLAVAWSPDGKLLAIGCIGEAGSRCMSSIQVWDPATGERLRKFDRVCLYNITNLAWSPEGKRIAACSGQTIQLWDAETGQPSGVILHNPQYHGLSLRADGHYRGDAKVEEAIVMVVQKEDGSTETLPPAEFAKTYGGKQGDAPPESAPDKQPDKDKPFVLLRDNKEVRAFKTLFGVFNEMQSGDTIEVHGNGPFPLGLVRLQGKDLSLRAAPGYRPTFVPSRPLTQQDHAWFEIKDGALNVAGCDFRLPTNVVAFAGGGKPWEMRNCRIRSYGPLAEYAGPRFRLADSLTQGPLSLGPKVELELDNNIFQLGELNSIFLQAPGGQTVRLRNNTIHLVNRSSALFTLQDARGVSVEAAGNILLFSDYYRVLFAIPSTDVRDRVRWSGRQNLYAGLVAPLGIPDPKTSTYQALDLEGKPLGANAPASLSKLLGRDEEGSRLAAADPQINEWSTDGPMLFRRHQVRQLDQAGIVRILRETTARLRQRPGLADVGPDWDVIGSGDAYVRALAAVGKPVAKDNLRPEAEEGGPFTLLRAGVAKGRGFDTLQNALNAIVPGDVIEIRSDGPFVGGGVTVAGVLTIRAAPGYRAVVDGNVTIAKGDVTLEGLHFRTGGPAIDPNGSHLVRLANCFFETRPNGRGFVARVGPGKQTEVVNCLTLDMLDGYLEKDGKLALRNSVVGSLIAGVDASSRVDLDRCLFWGPATKYLVWNGGRKDPLSISARRTILEDGGAGYLLYGLQHWKGSQNVYRIGAVDFSLDDWRKRWKEAEEGSVEDEPLILDPRQWRLLPQSPGYHAGTNGKDLGAEVDRIAVPTGLGEPARTK